MAPSLRNVTDHSFARAWETVAALAPDRIALVCNDRRLTFAQAGLTGRRKLVQSHLRDRLFEISRRNRLLYFKPSQASLNFTVASVPMVMNLASIRLEQLFVWHPQLAAEVIDGKPMNLGRWLRFEDQPYLPSALDKLMPAQLAEELLEVREGNLLAGADGCQGDGTGVLAQSQVDHRSDGETPFGGQTH